MGVVVEGADKLSPHLFVEEMQGADIEMGGGGRSNPLHKRNELEKETSESKFANHLKDQTKVAAEKGLKAEGANATEAMKTDALAKLMDGGGVPLERLNIAINYLQNFGLVLVIDIPWPEVRRSCCGAKGSKI